MSEYVAQATPAILTPLGRVEHRHSSEREHDGQLPFEVELSHTAIAYHRKFADIEVCQGQRLPDDAVRRPAIRIPVGQLRAFIHPFRPIHEIDPLLLYGGGEKVQCGADVDYRF
jgi:hypothetical protein